MSILCATNFSPEATAATTLAAELARQRGEQLWLVFVVPAHSQNAFGEDVLATADARLKVEAARARHSGATVTPALLIGKLHKELPRFAVDNKVSLVIAGDASSAPGATSSGALGRLGRVLEVPLWAVRNPEPVIAWAKGQRPLKVVVGVDPSRSAAGAIAWVEQLARFGAITLVAGHVYFPAAECHRFGLPLPEHWDEQSPELLAALQRELNAALPASLPHQLRLVPAIGRVSDPLCALAEEEQADLLVLGTHHRRALGRLWSVSEQCLPQAAMSVVCVPSPATAVGTDRPIVAIDRVLIATDFSATGDRAIAWGLGMLGLGGTADLVHVSAEPLTPDTERRVLAQLEARIPPEARARGLTVTPHAVTGPSPGAAIVAAAERFASAAIVLGSRSGKVAKVLFGSTAKGVLEQTHRPVLVVPPPEA